MQHNLEAKAFIASEALEKYVLVKWSSLNNVALCDEDDVPMGVTLDNVASGDDVSIRMINNGGTFELTAAGAFTAGDELYLANDGKVDDATTGGKAYFRALRDASGDNSIVECAVLAPAGSKSGLLFSNVANSASVGVSSTTEDSFDVNYTLDGAELKVGDVIRVKGRFHVIDNNSDNTLTLRLKFGTETIDTLTLADMTDNDIAMIDAEFTIRTLGASGTIQGGGIHGIGVIDTADMKPFAKRSAVEDMTGDMLIEFTGQYDISSADNEIQLEDMQVYLARQ